MAESALAKKLRIKSGHRMAVIHAPEGYLGLLGELPEGVSATHDLEGAFDMVQAFYTTLADLLAEAGQLKASVKEGGLLWISYPKKSAKVESDLSRDVLRKELAEQGLRPVALVSIDATWSALRFRPIA